MKKVTTIAVLVFFFELCDFSFGNAQQTAAYWPTEKWKSSTPESQGVHSEFLLRMIDSISTDPQQNIHSVIVIRNGYIIAEAYCDPYNETTTHNIKSASKSIISALVGIAIEKHCLSNLKQTVSEFHPAYTNDSLKRNISLFNLLTMSAGLDWQEGTGPSPFDLDSWKKVSVKYPPGSRFEYNTGLVHMMSAILTKASGISTRDFADRWLFAPLGIKDYQWSKSDDEIYHGGSDIFLTPREMAKFGLLYLNNGKWEGRQIVPEEWVKRSTGPIMSIPQDYPFGRGLHYGFWWWIDKHAYFAWGYGGQFIIVRPDLNLVIVFTAGFEGGATYRFIRPLLENYIYPAFAGDSQLTDNPATFEKLEKACRLWQNPPEQSVKRMPKTAFAISGERYVFNTNDAGFQSTSFDFTDSTCVWHYQMRGQRASLIVGLRGVYHINTSGLSLGVNPEGDKIACKGYWEGDTFLLQHHIIGDPTLQTFRFIFGNDSIRMHMNTLGMDADFLGISNK